MKKAYIVGISPMVRVITPADATKEQIIDLAIEEMRKNPNEYIHPMHCDEVREDAECPYSPETDETAGQGASKADVILEAYHRI